MRIIPSYRIVTRRSPYYRDIYYAQAKLFGLFWVDCHDLDFWIETFFPGKKIRYNPTLGNPMSGEISDVEKYIEKRVYKNGQKRIQRIGKNLKVVKRY